MLSIECHRGAAADRFLESMGGQWAELYARCPWATGFQSWSYARAWYGAYRGVHSPLILTAGNGSLEGLLALAVSAAGKLSVCGGSQAEYAVWLASPESSDAFILAALETLWREFPSGSLLFRYLPPGVPVGWCSARRRAVLIARPRPLIHLESADSENSLRKKSNRSRLNRMAALGPVSLEQVNSARDLEPYIDRIAACYDLRQGALYGFLPFCNDRLRRRFHLAMADQPGLAHATILKAGEELVAAHLGVAGAGMVSLGVIAYNPVHSRLSAGKLLLLMLSGRLRQQGYDYFDLTAGGDEYKERFSNRHDQTHILHVSAKRGGWWKGLAMLWLRFRLMPHWLLQLVRYVRRQHVGPSEFAWRMARKLLSRLWRREKVRIFSRSPQPGQDCPQFRVNCMEDLLLYRPGSRRDPTISEFLYDAGERLAAGARLYTTAEAGRLRHCAWLGRSGDHMILEAGFTEASIRQRLAEAARTPGVKLVLARVPAGDREGIANLEACGFGPRETVQRQVFLGRESTSVV